jgi:RHS repeat-associated protein
MRYKPWGGVRYTSGTTPTDYTYTGQRSEMDGFGLMYYNARWYDPALGRFAQADTIVAGEHHNSAQTMQDVAGTMYTPLTVGYYEQPVLSKLNADNAFIQGNGGSLLGLIARDKKEANIVGVPLGTQVFDRYAYIQNNPIRYTDPTGHLAFLAPLALITPVGWVAVGAAAVGVVVYFAVPGAREAVADGLYEAGEAVSNGIDALLAKGEYVPPGLSRDERNAYREAVHRYKKVWGLGGRDDVPREVLDEMADLIQEGWKPGEAAEAVDGPPEDDDVFDQEE